MKTFNITCDFVYSVVKHGEQIDGKKERRQFQVDEKSKRKNKLMLT